MTTLRGGRLILGPDISTGDLHFEDGRITQSSAGELIDVDGLIVAPGLIDIQINGGFGLDFTQDPTTIWEVGRRLPALGVTSFAPTIVTSPGDVTDLAIEVVARKPADYSGADVLGLHFEGPWIAPGMNGAHNPDHIVDPDPSVAEAWIASGQVRVVTLAPERPGADEVARALSRGGISVSIGHTAADYETAERALRAGAGLVTHLFNQMSPLRHREPGVVGAALLSDASALLIADGQHIADGALKIAWRMLGPDRVILVTDAMAALGLGPGTYPLGDGPITVGPDGPRTEDGRLAGSVVPLSEAIQNLLAITGASVPDALATTSINPARALRVTDRGALTTGSRADITVFDDKWDVVMTFVGGHTAPDR